MYTESKLSSSLQNRKYTPACVKSSRSQEETSILGILIALPFQFDNSAIVRLSAEPFTKNNSIVFPYFFHLSLL